MNKNHTMFFLSLVLIMMISLCGCDSEKVIADIENTEKSECEERDMNTVSETNAKTLNNEPEGSGNINLRSIEHIEALNPIKNPMDHNPLMTQAYSADPYALVYEGRVYLYMTGDEPMHEADGSLIKNNYSNINTIRVISSEDLVNWTDHGEILAAGKNGEATWGNNSWAPAACCKKIDGKDKFFLYFANSGNGIAVLTADSPTGPFTDPIGKALVSRETPTCAEVTWLFDPAVLVDDDGSGYLYFGGGVPGEDKISNPGTARVVKLADDMISLAEDPIPIENVLYLFEDSGINKIGDKYIYSYCSNFDVPDSGAEGYGFGRGEIVIMESDSPKGPFKTIGGILKNPEYFFNYGGNNHHCMFEFNNKWYVTYHASLVEEKLGENNGYRNVNIDEIEVGENGLFRVTRATKEGVKQLGYFDPFREVSFSTMANQAGVKTVPVNDILECKGNSCGDMNIKTVEEGAFTQITGVDCKDGASSCIVTVKATKGGCINIRSKYLNGDNIAAISLDAEDSFRTYEIDFNEELVGINDIYFVFDKSDIELKEWKFVSSMTKSTGELLKKTMN